MDNLVDMFEASAEKYAARNAIGTKRDGRWVWTRYDDLKSLVDRARGGLASVGLSAGDRIAIISNNRLEWLVAFHAAMGLGAVVVPMYESQRPSDWRFMLRDCGARLAVTSSSRILGEVEKMGADLPALERVFAFDVDDSTACSFHSLQRRGERLPAALGRQSPGAVAEIVYTSGTTGKAKGVVLTHANIVADVTAMQKMFPIEPGERTVSFLPWAHVLGQIAEAHNGLSSGACLALNRNPKQLLDDLRDVKPTLLVVVPAVFNMIYQSVQQQMAGKPAAMQKLLRDGLDSAERKMHGEHLGAFRELELLLDDKLVFSRIREKLGGELKWVFSGGAPLDPEVARLVDALGITVHEGYGLTETSCTVSMQPKGARKLGTVGRPLPGVRIDVDRSVTGDPRVGELVVHGPMVTKGYYSRPEENAKAFTPDGGLRTGDLGYFDEDGHLVIAGRIKEQYKLDNGKYVMPARMEEKLELSPFILHAMLFGDGRPFNVVLVAPNRCALSASAEGEGRALDGDWIRVLLESEVAVHSQGFARYEVPRHVLILEDEPTVENGMLTPTLKLRRKEVLARYGSWIEAVYAAEARAAE
jgi:long-chain acyl-CoA synthetase